MKAQGVILVALVIGHADLHADFLLKEGDVFTFLYDCEDQGVVYGAPSGSQMSFSVLPVSYDSGDVLRYEWYCYNSTIPSASGILPAPGLFDWSAGGSGAETSGRVQFTMETGSVVLDELWVSCVTLDWPPHGYSGMFDIVPEPSACSLFLAGAVTVLLASKASRQQRRRPAEG